MSQTSWNGKKYLPTTQKLVIIKKHDFYYIMIQKKTPQNETFTFFMKILDYGFTSIVPSVTATFPIPTSLTKIPEKVAFTLVFELSVTLETIPGLERS